MNIYTFIIISTSTWECLFKIQTLKWAKNILSWEHLSVLQYNKHNLFSDCMHNVAECIACTLSSSTHVSVALLCQSFWRLISSATLSSPWRLVLVPSSCALLFSLWLHPRAICWMGRACEDAQTQRYCYSICCSTLANTKCLQTNNWLLF